VSWFAGRRALAALALLKLAVSFALLGLGFHGVSDDDFARIVIAQEFAHAPKLDPSGTSWLPLPFWITGGAMKIFGYSPAVAVAVGIVLGVLSVWLVYAAARRFFDDDESAFWGAALVAVLPWSARLGASALPELPVAAASLFAILSLAGSSMRSRLIGSALLLAACLSRYEPWFLAAGFAAYCLRDARKRDGARLANLLCAVLPLAGPIAWSAWNAHAHGSPTHYLDRVAAYKQAIDQGAIVERVTSYFLAVFRAEPELIGALAFLAWVARASMRAELSRARRPLILLGMLLLTLTASSIKGGAPTHHPERALLTLHLFLAIVAAHLAVVARRDELLVPLQVVAAVLVIGGGVATLRGTLLFKESVAHREAELAVGREVAARVPAGERVYLEVVDYGYFAVQAASERPWDFVLSGKVDPARGGEVLGESVVRARAAEQGLTHAVGLQNEARYTLWSAP
jgi:hypothetical protein